MRKLAFQLRPWNIGCGYIKYIKYKPIYLHLAFKSQMPQSGKCENSLFIFGSYTLGAIISRRSSIKPYTCTYRLKTKCRNRQSAKICFPVLAIHVGCKYIKYTSSIRPYTRIYRLRAKFRNRKMRNSFPVVALKHRTQVYQVYQVYIKYIAIYLHLMFKSQMPIRQSAKISSSVFDLKHRTQVYRVYQVYIHILPSNV